MEKIDVQYSYSANLIDSIDDKSALDSITTNKVDNGIAKELSKLSIEIKTKREDGFMIVGKTFYIMSEVEFTNLIDLLKHHKDSVVAKSVAKVLNLY